MANYVYIVTELTFFDDDSEENKIGVVCSNKNTAVKAVNLAISQIVNNKSKKIYTNNNWYKNYHGDWCKSIEYLMDGEFYYTRLTITKKEVI